MLLKIDAVSSQNPAILLPLLMAEIVKGNTSDISNKSPSNNFASVLSDANNNTISDTSMKIVFPIPDISDI